MRFPFDIEETLPRRPRRCTGIIASFETRLAALLRMTSF